jgi:hypothetical protein
LRDSDFLENRLVSPRPASIKYGLEALRMDTLKIIIDVVCGARDGETLTGIYADGPEGFLHCAQHQPGNLEVYTAYMTTKAGTVGEVFSLESAISEVPKYPIMTKLEIDGKFHDVVGDYEHYAKHEYRITGRLEENDEVLLTVVATGQVTAGSRYLFAEPDFQNKSISYVLVDTLEGKSQLMQSGTLPFPRGKDKNP